MVRETSETQPKIMVKPLPMILDEIEADHQGNKALIEELRRLYSQLQKALEKAAEATTEAKEAAGEARAAGVKAAEVARLAGIEAAGAAKKAAEAEIAKVKEEAAKAIDTMGMRVSGLESDLDTLKKMVAQEALAVDKGYGAGKDAHLVESPFLERK